MLAGSSRRKSSLGMLEAIYAESESQRDEAFQLSSLERQKQFSDEEKAQAQGEIDRGASAESSLSHLLSTFQSNNGARDASFHAADAQQETAYHEAEAIRDALVTKRQMLQAAVFERDQGIRAKHAEWCIAAREAVIILGRKRREEASVKIRSDLEKALRERLQREEDAFQAEERLKGTREGAIKAILENGDVISENSEPSTPQELQPEEPKTEDLERESYYLYTRTSGKYTWDVISTKPPDESDGDTSEKVPSTISVATTPILASPLENGVPPADGNVVDPEPHSDDYRDPGEYHVVFNASATPLPRNRSPLVQDLISAPNTVAYQDNSQIQTKSQVTGGPSVPPALLLSPPSALLAPLDQEKHQSQAIHDEPSHERMADYGANLTRAFRSSRAFKRRNDLDAFGPRFALTQQRRHQIFLDEGRDMQARFEVAEDVRDKAEAYRDKAYDLMVADCLKEFEALMTSHDETFSSREAAREGGEAQRERAFEAWDAQCKQVFELEVLHVRRQVSARAAHEDKVAAMSLLEPLQALVEEHKDLVYATRKAQDTRFREAQAKRGAQLDVTAPEPELPSVLSSAMSSPPIVGRMHLEESDSPSHRPNVLPFSPHPFFRRRLPMSPAAGFAPTALFRGTNVQDSLLLPGTVNESQPNREYEFHRFQYIFERSQDRRDTVFENGQRRRRYAFDVAETRRQLMFEKKEQKRKEAFCEAILTGYDFVGSVSKTALPSKLVAPTHNLKLPF
ncbi:hypothetical protein DXG01_007715 [Tephrocybe rancida]|nr:hypothetical protein DXG01_007715 [Tephrocybe rancida]